jgi:hypothetical protein
MSYDRAVELALERKQDPTEYLNLKTRTPEPVNCEGCGHPISFHDPKYGCDYEKDVWVSGTNADGLVALPCGCGDHAAETDPLQLLLRRAYEEKNKNATT